MNFQAQIDIFTILFFISIWKWPAAMEMNWHLRIFQESDP